MKKTQHEQNGILIKCASYSSVVIALIIMIVKLYGWLITDSQSILASLVDAFLDISSSLINLIAINIALTPPDKNHRFGHGKFQDLAIFSQSIFFFASGIFTIVSSSRALYNLNIPNQPELGINLMIFCTALTFFLVSFQTYVIRETGSKIIEADKIHYFSDFMTNIGVVISLYLSSYFWFIDSIVGILVSFYIIFSSYRLFRESVKNLVDEEFDEEERMNILKIIKKFKEAKGLHELKTRAAGDKPFIQFHLELNGDLTLRESHIISDKISNELLKYYPNAEIIIHQDPEGEEQEDNDLEKICV